MRTRLLIGTATFVVLAACCVGGTAFLSRGDAHKTIDNAQPSGAAKTSAASKAVCLTVDPALLALIDDQAQQGTGLQMTGRAAAVRSPDFAKVYLVAAEFTATGVPPQVGVWATNSLTGNVQLILAADGTAKAFTNWDDAAKTDARISAADHAVLDAKACLT